LEKIRIGTRASKLALWQAEHVEKLLQLGGLQTELVKMETKGDLKLDVSISKIGSKGVFTEELEDALREGRCDIAVHSAKDMPSELPHGLSLLAFTKREAAHDVLISHKTQLSLNNEDLVIGTSSTRRVAMLRHYYPNIRAIPVRGNLQTRVKKMEDGQCDGLLLAFAGAHRMNFDHMIIEQLPLDKFTPPTGQGCITVEVHESLPIEKKLKIKELVNDADAESELSAERAFLKKMQGGCSVPVFCLARKTEDDITVTGGVISLNGKNIIRHTLSGEAANAADIGIRLAEKVLNDGGKEILIDVKKNL
jgi:hydroxymethylbilane synthase